MKARSILTALLLSAPALSASADNVVRFGVTTSMNVSNITNTEMDSRLGFHVGVRVEPVLSRMAYLNIGLLFTQKGCKATVRNAASAK